MRFASFAALSLLALGGLTYLLLDHRQPIAEGGGEPLSLYCAAGLQPTVEKVLHAYKSAYGVAFQTKYRGSGDLVGDIALDPPDLFLSADRMFLDQLRREGRIAEILPIAVQRPRLVVRRGNPLQLGALADLNRPGLRLSLARPESAAISKTVRKLLGPDRWNALWAASQERGVQRATVNEVANDVKLDTADAGFVWDATLPAYPDLEALELPELVGAQEEIAIGVTTASGQPARALHFARYLTAPEQGLRPFAEDKYQVVAGDPWVERPEIVFYSGGLMHKAVEQAIERFERREGVKVLTKFQGCGDLVAGMRGGDRPDAYFACERVFLDKVAELFHDGRDLSRTAMVIVTAPGNPRGIKTLAELASPEFKVALSDPDRSALGHLTDQLLEKHGLKQAVRANARVTWPSAPELVQAVVVGGVDAAIVYRANTALVREQLEILPIDDPQAVAVQPIAVSKTAQYPRLTQRLLDTITGRESQTRFTELGFEWRGRP